MKSHNDTVKQQYRLVKEIVFPMTVIVLYGILFVLYPGKTRSALLISGEVLLHILPILALILVFMVIINSLCNPKKIARYVGKTSGIRGWCIAMGAGILSHGPIYVWYLMLRDLRDHGMRNGLIAVFLYNRAIKVPLLPLMIFYFNIPFVIVLLCFMILASILLGKIIEWTVNDSAETPASR